MVEGDDESIINMKFILYCFEWLSGLKINYHKSEAFVFGMNDDGERRVVNMLNCKLRRLPIKYLGVPLSDRKIKSEDMSWLSNKIAKRIPPWKDKQMSSGARLILTSNCLSSLATYVMGFYLLTQGTHKKMDRVRSRFFWREVGDSFKYHMVKWQVVCRPKEFGGYGL
jgi:hypothetical protein